MNSKSFIFGKNYDSDYLSGKRLKRKSYGQRNDKNFRRIQKIGHKVDNRTENQNPIEKCRKHLVKRYDKRLTLKPRPIETSTESYRRDYGLYANGKTSNVVNNDRLFNHKKQFKARIQEDLFWILNHKSRNKRHVPEDSHKGEDLNSPSPQHKTKPSQRHKSIYTEKETQINSVISLDTKSSINDMKLIPREDKLMFRSNRLNRTENPLNARNIAKTHNKSPPKKSTKSSQIKINCIKANNYNRSERIRSSLSSQKAMPSLPTSLTIVQNLMNSYERERKGLGNTIPEFAVDLVTQRCDQIKEISKSFKQSIGKNLIQTNNSLKVKNRTINPTPKSSKKTIQGSKNMMSDESDQHLSVVPYNQDEAQMALKQFEPRVGDMLSRLLLNISDAFQTLSSKCVDKSFFD